MWAGCYRGSLALVGRVAPHNFSDMAAFGHCVCRPQNARGPADARIMTMCGYGRIEIVAPLIQLYHADFGRLLPNIRGRNARLIDPAFKCGLDPFVILAVFRL